MNDARPDKTNNAAGIARSVLVAAALMVAPAKHPLIVIEVETLHWTSAKAEVQRGASGLIWHASQDCKTIRHSGEIET